jgi:uncharacterized membrane protein
MTSDRRFQVLSGIPVLIFLALAAALFLTLPAGTAVIVLGILFAYIASPAGKETLIPLMILLGLPWWTILCCLSVTDICCALMIGWNFPLLLKVPWAGPRLERWTKRTGRYLENRPGLARLSGFGLYFFTMIPFQGFGTITGTILGTMLGMNRVRVFVTVVAGGFTASFLLAFGLSRLVRFYEQFPAELIIIAAVIAGAAIAGYLYFRGEIADA